MNVIHPSPGPIFEELEGCEVTYAKTQTDKYILLRTLSDGTTVMSRWTPTQEQRQAIAAGNDIFLEVKTFGAKLQPVRLTVGLSLAEARGILGLTEE